MFLRSNPDEVEKHLKEFDERLRDSSKEIIKELGDISTTITIDKTNYLLKWPALLQIFYAIGTQTLQFVVAKNQCMVNYLRN
jgi:hypothetical protein